MKFSSNFLTLVLRAALASGLSLDVRVHYPEKDSAIEHCGFRLRISTSLGNPDEDASTPTLRRGPNLFGALLHLPDSDLQKQAIVGVMADVNQTELSSAKCLNLCQNGIGPQGKVVQLGVYKPTAALAANNSLDLWPSFCIRNAVTYTASFSSVALGRNVQVRYRIPSLTVENMLPRPSEKLPPIMFRLNGEWYWPFQQDHYDMWHNLMLDGHMEPIVIGEVFVENVTHESWVNQPIYTASLPQPTCKTCDPEYKFICDSWESSGNKMYNGSEHNFGSATSFFAELYDSTIPSILQRMPANSDNETLRVGVWGYCIGGLGAWSAVTTNPERYNIAYLGSPALDFNCGESIHHASAVVEGKLTPKIYIDAGAAEGGLMNGQTALLFDQLQKIGLMKGRDVFYERAPFGTHQSNSLLRRSTVGLLTLFGTENSFAIAIPSTLTAASGENASSHSLLAFSGIFVLGVSVAFLVGRKSARSPRHEIPESSFAHRLLA